MWSKLAEIYNFIYFDACVKLFPAHGRVVEAFEMDHEDPRKPEDGQLLGEGVHSFALFAFEATFLHPLRLHKGFKTIVKVHCSRDANASSWKGET